jgi:hypothetical protein
VGVTLSGQGGAPSQVGVGVGLRASLFDPVVVAVSTPTGLPYFQDA